MDWSFVGVTGCEVIQILACFAIVFHRILQMLLVLVLLQLWKQGSQSGLRVSNEAKVQLAAASQMLAAKVNLHDGRVLGKEIAVWKVCAEHQQDFAVHHGVIAGGESEQSCHAHVKGVVVLDEFFATIGMHDGRLEFAGNFHELRMGSSATRAAEDGDLFRSIQELGKDVEFFIRWTNGGFRFMKTYARPLDGIFQSHVPGQHNHGDSTLRDGRLNGGFQNARHLVGVGDKLAVVAALREDMFRVGLLKVCAANLPTRDMCGNSEYWNTVALTVVKPINQMHVAGPAAPCAHRQFPREMRFGSRSKSSHLFMPDVHPINTLFYAH